MGSARPGRHNRADVASSNSGRLPDDVRDLRVHNVAVRSARRRAGANILTAFEVIYLAVLKRVVFCDISHLAAGRNIRQALHAKGADAGVLRKLSKSRSEERRVGKECRSRW